MNKTEDEIYTEIELKTLDGNLGWQKFEKDFEALKEISEPLELFGFNLKQAFEILKKKSMLDIYDNYRNNFCLLNLPEFNKRPFVTVILLMDLETGWGIEPETKLYQQIIEIKKILPRRPILPFLPINPRRDQLNDYSGESAPLFRLKVSHPESGFIY